MIARACEWNPSVFRKSGEKDDIFNVSETICMSYIWNYKRISLSLKLYSIYEIISFQVIKIYLEYAFEYDYPFTIVKYNLQNILGSQQVYLNSKNIGDFLEYPWLLIYSILYFDAFPNRNQSLGKNS